MKLLIGTILCISLFWAITPFSVSAQGSGRLGESCSTGTSCEFGTICDTTQEPPICVIKQSPGVQTVTPAGNGVACGNSDLGFVSIVCLPFLVKYDTIGTLLSGIFQLAIAFGAIAAVLMLVIGGFQYMTQDAVGGQKEARARIQGAVFGLLLLLLSYLILFVINPEILKSIDTFEAKLRGPQSTQTQQNNTVTTGSNSTGSFTNGNTWSTTGTLTTCPGGNCSQAKNECVSKTPGGYTAYPAVVCIDSSGKITSRNDSSLNPFSSYACAANTTLVVNCTYSQSGALGK